MAGKLSPGGGKLNGRRYLPACDGVVLSQGPTAVSSEFGAYRYQAISTRSGPAGAIAMLAAARLRRPEITFVFMASCGEGTAGVINTIESRQAAPGSRQVNRLPDHHLANYLGEMIAR